MLLGGCISRDSIEDTVGQLETVGEIRLEWGMGSGDRGRLREITKYIECQVAIEGERKIAWECEIEDG